MTIHALMRIAVLTGLLSAALVLSACKNTILFSAQREIDVAASINEDTAEPVVVNIGFNSQIAGLVPAVSERTSSDANSIGVTAPNDKSLTFNRPAGEAASIFSGFHYISATGFSTTPGQPPFQYDTEIRSQFASGAAAIILAKNPIAVKHVVDVDQTFSRGPEFLADANVALRNKLLAAIDGLSKEKAKALYDAPPTTDDATEAYIKKLKVKSNVMDTCDTSDLCHRDVLRERISGIELLDDLKKWEMAFSAQG